MKFFSDHSNLRRKQATNITVITFWSQFATYALHSILILFLTKPILQHGLGYNDAKAYAFIGVSQATGYLMPLLGGHIADTVLGLRRSILVGSILLALAYLLIVGSGYTIPFYGDRLFIMAYALIPASNALLMGTASGMVSHIYSDDAVRAKAAMTFYYLSINVGGLLATIVAPVLLNSRYGPLSVLTLAFLGKSIATLNFAARYSLYDSAIWGKDTMPLAKASVLRLVGCFIGIYLFTLFAYSYIFLASILVSVGSGAGIVWFLVKTLQLSGETRRKQLIACLLLLESIVFFVIYNQMNSTLVLFAKNNSNAHLLNFTINPAQYQMLNPLLIIAIGLQLPRLYQKFPKFSIPYQFASGTLLAGLGLLIVAYAASQAVEGIIDGNYIALVYICITFAELLVSAIGLSMIGLYCDNESLGFAMGVWYLASSLSNALSGRIAGWVALPEGSISPLQSLPIYQNYYSTMGLITCCAGGLMLIFAFYLHQKLHREGVILA